MTSNSSASVETEDTDALVPRLDLFRSDDFVVRAIIGFDSTVCVVTFDSYTDDRTLDRRGFGEHFFADRRIDAIHVVARSNDWYQHEEIFAICKVIASVSSRYQRVYAYGSSMGGYAAVRFGALVGAETAIALSPQYSIDKSVVPFEYRWAGDARRIRFAVERRSRHPFVTRAYVCYDPTDLDRRHVELIRGKTALIEIPIPHAGHPVIGFLAEAGLLADLVLGVVYESLDIPTLKARARSERKRTAHFWNVLADRTRHPKTRIALAERALSLAPGNIGYQIKLARALALAEEFEAAEVLFKQALEAQPTNPVLLFNLSEMYEWRGDYAGALEIAERLVEAHPDAHIFDHRVTYLANRRRIATVVSGVGHVARHGVARPLGAIYRRMRDRVRAPAADEAAGAELPVEILVATTPSPPPFVQSWLRHVDLIRDTPSSPVDLVLVGDSHVQYWPPALWGGRSTFNLGVAADKTQHALWRLLALPDGAVNARDAMLMIGVNNLGADDTPAGIAAGVRECVREIARVAPNAMIHVVALPPCGESLDFRDRDRRRANGLDRSRRPSDFVEADALLRVRRDGEFVCYQSDFIHLSEEGYAALTKAVVGRLRG